MTTKKLIRHYRIDWESSGYIGSLNKSCWCLEGTFQVNHWINNITSLTGNWSTKLTSYEDSFKIPISFEIFALLFSPLLLFPFTTLLTVAHAIVVWLTKNNLKQTTHISAWYHHFLKPETFLISEKTLTSNLILPHAKIPWAIIQDTWLEIKTKKLQTYDKKIKKQTNKSKCKQNARKYYL